ncbi:helix-turn-helix domain-containing protein [Vibrio sp. 10N.286.49.A11]|uniref:helix-turn-helix domain-containing protein n=1 Tax=Vibrio sp. 10N.286.49.A11 TaxID=3229700 RepID=UPI00354F89B1
MIGDGLRVNEAARVTGISRNTLYRYMRSGKLSYTEKDGVRYLDRNEINAITPTELAQQDLFSVSNVTPDTPSNAELCAEIKALRSTVTKLTNALVTLSDVVTRITDTPRQVTTPKKSSTPPTSDNERRAKEAQAKVFAVLEIYKDTSKKPSIRAMAEEAGVERGTFSKHKKTWDQK